MKKTTLVKTMLLLCALVVGSSNVWAVEQTAGYTPSAALSSTTGTVKGKANETWSYSITFHENSYYGYASTYGWQIGASDSGGHKRGCKAFSISTSDITGTITKIEVEAGSYQGNSKINVTVGGNDFGTQNQSTYSGQGASKSTFTGEATGEIVISATDAVRAFYLKSITVTYSTGSSSDPSISLSSSSIEATEAEKDGTINVTYNNIASVDAEVLFYESNGTTAATYDWLDAEINATDNTKLDYMIGANTGAARTAYMKVHQKNTEVYSSLITITQAAKSVASPEFNLDGGSYMQGTNITISSTGNTVYYNLTTDGSTPSNPTNASTEYTSPIALGSGTTKIKAIAYDTYGNASSVVTRTYTGIALASLPFSWTGTKTAGKDELAAETGVAVSLGSNYADSNAPYRLKFDGTSKYVTIYTDEKPENVYFTAKLFNAASTGSKIKVQGSADGITFDDVEEFTIKGSANDTFEFSTSNAFAATHRAVKLIMSSKDQNVAVGTICVSCVPITPAKTYTTLTSAYNLDFTGVSGLKAYIATEISGGKVQMTQVNKVPAGTGLVLKATTPGSAVNVPVFDGTSPDDVSENKMVGSATATTAIAANGGYILSDGVFQPASAGTLPAGKAYLNIAVSAARSLEMSFDDENVTAIESVKAQNAVKGEYFNLAGQRVAQPTKGLYIVNGHKVIVK